MTVEIKMNLEYCRFVLSRLELEPEGREKDRSVQLFKTIEKAIMDNPDVEVCVQVPTDVFERAVNARIEEIN